MKILVLHNNNLPVYLRQGAQGEPNVIAQDNELVHYAFSLPQTDIPDFDTFTSEKLAFLEKERYDLIILPYNLSEAHIEYSGLRVAAHIRLTPKWNALSTPILFLGIDKVDEIQKLSLLGGILFSNNVYHSDKTGLDELIKIFSWINNHTQLQDVPNEEIMESQEYQSLLQRLKTMPVPANYATHHTIANEWAILRWKEMINWKVVKQEPTLPEHSKHILNMLYFKYLNAKHGTHDRFKKEEHKKSPIIEGLEGKTIVYIDDEFDKGWENILRIIFESSGVQFNCYHDFDKSLTKEQLIRNIENYIATTDADCYILDLRLHEDDFSETKDLTGHQIAEYIKTQNKGNQIVVFSASNKIWNLKEDLFNDKIKATGYALKESPDQNLNRDESKLLFSDFINSVRLACSQSYLKELYNKQKELVKINTYFAKLDSFLDLLSLDMGSNNQDLISAALLTEVAFIEDYINYLGYELLTTGKRTQAEKVTLYSPDGKQYDISGHMFFKRIMVNKRPCVTEVSDFYEEKTETPEEWGNAHDSDITLSASTLFKGYGLTKQNVQKYVHLKFLRNTQIAHYGDNEKSKIQLSELIDFYFDVICKIVETK